MKTLSFFAAVLMLATVAPAQTSHVLHGQNHGLVVLGEDSGVLLKCNLAVTHCDIEPGHALEEVMRSMLLDIRQVEREHNTSRWAYAYGNEVNIVRTAWPQQAAPPAKRETPSVTTPPAPAPAASPAKVAIPPSTVKDELASALHKRDAAQKQISDLQLNFIQVQAQATQKLQALQAQEKQATDAIDAAKKKLLAAAKLDPAHYTVSEDPIEAVAKPEPKK
jgi:hypothetical protein